MDPFPGAPSSLGTYGSMTRSSLHSLQRSQPDLETETSLPVATIRKPEGTGSLITEES